MSDSFVIAARLPLAKKKVTAWLRTPWPESLALSAMFEGRAWDGREGPSWTPKGKAKPKTVRHFFASVADGVCEGHGGLVLAWDGRAKCVWLHQLSVGFDEARIAGAFIALSAAAPHLAAKKSVDAILTAEPSGRLDADGVLAVMQVDTGGIRFDADAAPIVKALAPVEERFVAALGEGLDVAMREPTVLHPQVRQLAKSATLTKTTWKVPELGSAEAFLDAVSCVRFVPDAEDRARVHAVIYDELVNGVVLDTSRRAYVEVIGRLVDAGVDGVIAGCTEIELLVGPDDVDTAWFPTAALHVEACGRWLLGEDYPAGPA